jgi:hypothetical protein
MIYLWVEQIDGQYRISWEDHDDHDKTVARGVSLMRSDGSSGPRLAVDANAAQLEVAIGRKLGQRKG